MTRPPSPAGERTDPTCAAFHDRFGERTVIVDADTGDAIEHLQVAPVLAAQERAIRERVERLANFRHVRFPRLRGVESSGSGSDRRVVVAADHVPGHRLSALLAFVDRHPTLSVDVNAALQVVREVLPALAVLHDSRGVTHGTVGLERMVLTAQGRVMLVDYVLGLAVERLQYPRSRLWKDFRLAMPPTAGVPRLDQRADVAQVALGLLALLLGRPVAFGEFPEGLRPLLQSAVERLPDGTVRPLSAPLRTWLERALPLESRKPFTTALDAQVAFEDLIKKARGYSPSAASLKAFRQRYENCVAKEREKEKEKENAPAEAKKQETPARASTSRAKVPTTSPAPVQGETRRPAAATSPGARRPAAPRLSPEEEAAEEIRSLEAELARLTGAGAGDGRPGTVETSSPPEPTVGPAAEPVSGTTLAAGAKAPAGRAVEAAPPSRSAPLAATLAETPRPADELAAAAPARAGTEASATTRAEPGSGQQPERAVRTAAPGPAGESGAAAARHRASPRAARARAMADTAASADAPEAGLPRVLVSSPRPETDLGATSASAEPPRALSPELEEAPALAVPEDAAAEPPRAASPDLAPLSEATRPPADSLPAPSETANAGKKSAHSTEETAATAHTLDVAELGEPETEVLVLGPPLPAIEIVSMPDGTETRLVVTDDRAPGLTGAAKAAAAPAVPEEEDEVAYLERVLRELAASEAAAAATPAATSPAAWPAPPSLSPGDAALPAESRSASEVQPLPAPQPAARAADVGSGAAGVEPEFPQGASEGFAAPPVVSESAAVAAAGTTETDQTQAAASTESSLVAAATGAPETSSPDPEADAGWRLEPPPAEDAGAVASPLDDEAEEQPACVDEWSLWLDFEKEPEPVALVPAREPFHRRLRRRHGRPRVSRADVTRLQMLTAIHGRDDGSSRPQAGSARPRGTSGAPRASRRAAAGRPAPRALPAEATPVPAAVVLKPATGMAHIVARAAAASGVSSPAPLMLAPPAASARRTQAAVPAALPERCDEKTAPLARLPERSRLAALGNVPVEGVADPAVVRLVPGLAVDTLLRELRGPDAIAEPSVAEVAEPGEQPPSVSEAVLRVEVVPGEVGIGGTVVAPAAAGASGLAAPADDLPVEPIALPRLEDLAPAEFAAAAGNTADAAVLQVEPSAEDELRRLLAVLSAEADVAGEAATSTAPPATPPPDAGETSLAAWALDEGDALDVDGLTDGGDTSGWLAEALLEPERGEGLTGESTQAGLTPTQTGLDAPAPAAASAGTMGRTEAVVADAATSASAVEFPVEVGSANVEAAAAASDALPDAESAPALEPPVVAATPDAPAAGEVGSSETGQVPRAVVAGPEVVVAGDRDQLETLPVPAEAIAGTQPVQPGQDAVPATAFVLAEPSVTQVESVAPAAAEFGTPGLPSSEAESRETTPQTTPVAFDLPETEIAAAPVRDEGVPGEVVWGESALEPTAGMGASVPELKAAAPPAAAGEASVPAAADAVTTAASRAPAAETAGRQEEADAPVIQLRPTAVPSPVGVASDAALVTSDSSGAAAATARPPEASQARALSARDGGTDRPADVAVPAPRGLRLVPSAGAVPPAASTQEPASRHGHGPAGPADTPDVPAAQAVGAEGLQAPAERPSLRAVPAGRKERKQEAAEGQPPRETRAPRPGKKTARRRGKRGRPAVVPPAVAAPASASGRPGQTVRTVTPGVGTWPAPAAAGVGAAPAVELPQGQAATPGRSPEPATRTPQPTRADIAARLPADRPHPAEPGAARGDESPPDLALVYAPWRLSVPAPAGAPSREVGEGDAPAVDPWDRAPETARIRLAPPEIPQVGSSGQEPVAVSPGAAVPAIVVPAAVPVDPSAPVGGPAAAPVTASPDQAGPEADAGRPARREPLLFESWQDRAPAVPAARRWRVDWKRTAAAALVVVLLEGVAFATAYWLVRPPENGTLLVQTSEAGVEVWIDGRPRGRTPLSVDLEPGRHTLEMRGFGAAKTMPVEISPGVQTTQFVRWRRAQRTGVLKVTTTPDGARILVDGRYRGVSPLVIENLPAGRHTIVAEHASGTVSSAVDVAADATTEADIGIFSGWLTVFAPIEVRIFLGGRFLGTSLDGKLLVPPGHHEIEVVNTRLGYRETRTVDIEPGRTTAVSIEAPEGSIAIEAPDGTEVSIDGKVVGVMPLGPLPAPIGTREVVLRHPQIGQRRIAVSVGLNAPARVSLLAPQ